MALSRRALFGGAAAIAATSAAGGAYILMAPTPTHTVDNKECDAATARSTQTGKLVIRQTADGGQTREIQSNGKTTCRSFDETAGKVSNINVSLDPTPHEIAQVRAAAAKLKEPKKERDLIGYLFSWKI